MNAQSKTAKAQAKINSTPHNDGETFIVDAVGNSYGPYCCHKHARSKLGKTDSLGLYIGGSVVTKGGEQIKKCKLHD